MRNNAIGKLLLCSLFVSALCLSADASAPTYYVTAEQLNELKSNTKVLTASIETYKNESKKAKQELTKSTEELIKLKLINERQRLMLREASTQLEAQKVQLDDLKKSLEKSKGNASIKYLYALAGIVAGYYFAR